MAGRRPKVIRRTTVPADALQSLGNMIGYVLREEHIRWQRAASRRQKMFTVERVCDATRIPYGTMTAYLQGKRSPTILDLRDICKFAGVTMEEVMEVIPSRIELDEVWKQANMDRTGVDDDDSE